jgi:YggT family protein
MGIVRIILNLYIIVIIIDGILSFFPEFRERDWRIKFQKLSDFSCEPIRKRLPNIHLPIDPSPLIVILLIQIFKILW